jgi:hypothetical protein
VQNFFIHENADKISPKNAYGQERPITASSIEESSAEKLYLHKPMSTTKIRSEYLHNIDSDRPFGAYFNQRDESIFSNKVPETVLREIDQEHMKIPSKYYTGTEKQVGTVISHKMSLKNKFKSNLLRQQLSQAKKKMSGQISRNQLE